MNIARTFSRPASMMDWFRLALALIVLLGVVPGPGSPVSGNVLAASVAQASDALADVGRLLLSFVPNYGQTDSQVRFQANSSGGAVFFTPDEVVIALPLIPAEATPIAVRELDSTPPSEKSVPLTVTRLHFLGANSSPAISGLDQLPGTVNYFLGTDPSKWHTGLPTFAGIVYHDLYPGIDLHYNGTEGQLKSTYLVAAGADPGRIRWSYQDALAVKVDAASGNLLVSLPGATTQTQPAARDPQSYLAELAPVAWQEVQGQRVPVASRYVLNNDGSVSFALPKGYDPARPLTLDPTLIYSTYLGDFAEDNADDVAIDGSGNMYVSGLTFSTNFPTQNPTQGFNAGDADAYVTKLNAAGSALVYSTYLGGTGTDYGLGMAVDTAGNAYLTGLTTSTDFPTAGTPYETDNGGIYDAFVSKVNPTGTLLYSTYLGGDGVDFGLDIAVDPAGGVAYVTGRADADFPTAGTPYQTTFGGGASDGFLAKVATTLTGAASLPYSTYFGGSDEDRGGGVTVDSAAGTAYLTGRTASTDFPLAGTPYQNTNGGSFDAFVMKLNTTVSGSAGLVYSPYLGGSGNDRALAIARDASNNAYVTGLTLSTDFPASLNAVDATCGTDGNCDFIIDPVNGNQSFTDAFVAKVNPAASGAASLVYGTYLGGNRRDQGLGISVDPSTGEAYVTGYTNSTNYPVQNAFQPNCGWGCGQVFSDPLIEGFTDAFITHLNAGGTALVFSSYLGGSSADFGFGILLDSSTHTLYLAGESYSSDYPVLNPYQGFNAGNYDVVVTKFDNAATAASDVSVTQSDWPDPAMAGGTVTYTLTINAGGPNTATGVSLLDALPENGAVFFNGVTSSQGGCSLANSFAVSCNLGDMAMGATAQVTITVGVSTLVAGLTLTNTASVSSYVVDPNGANNTDTENTKVSAWYFPLVIR